MSEQDTINKLMGLNKMLNITIKCNRNVAETALKECQSKAPQVSIELFNKSRGVYHIVSNNFATNDELIAQMNLNIIKNESICLDGLIAKQYVESTFDYMF